MEKKSRINKYLSEVGFCSRRQADKLITSGRVFFNGKQAILGDKVSIFDEVLVDNKKITPAIKDKIYIAFNKPLGVVCTTDKKREKNNIIDYINYPHRIFPIGRLDKNSEGLIFLTNDGDIVNKILRSKNNHQKEYDVKVDKPITKKPAEVRMGKGKGAPEYWAAVVKPGRIMFELDGVPLEIAREALRLAAQKLPITTKFVVRRDYV